MTMIMIMIIIITSSALVAVIDVHGVTVTDL